MGKFITPLEVRVLRGRQLTKRPSYLLTAPLEYQSDILGTTIVVPKDFVTDFSSIPLFPLFVAWGMLGDVAHYPSVIHDYLVRSKGKITNKEGIIYYYDKQTADDVFEEAMSHDNHILEYQVDDHKVPWAPRKVMYLAVRTQDFPTI